MTTIFTKGYKVTLYSDSLRATALYAIYTNDTAIKEDSVNTSIIHLYSTLPHNGRIHGYLKNTGINKGSRTGRFCSSWQDPKTKDRTGQVGRVEANRQ